MAKWNFQPTAAGTQTISATTSSSSVNFAGASGNMRQVLIYNAGSALAFVEFGRGSATAVAATSMPIPSGAVEGFDLGVNDTVAAITASSTATVYVTIGIGVV